MTLSPVWRRIIPLLAVAALLLTGCSRAPAPGPAPPGPGAEPGAPAAPGPGYDLNGGFARLEEQGLPSELRGWIDNSRPLMLGQSRMHGNYLYILVTYGEKTTGGYAVSITDLVKTAESLVVRVRFTRPEPGRNVTEEATHPYDIVVTTPTDKEIRFEALGDETHVPTLLGLDHLQTIVAGKDGIQVFAPAPGSTVPDPFLFHGVANTFEGTVNYRVETRGGEVLLEGFTTGAMGDWGYFRELVHLPATAPADLILRIFTYSAEDGSMAGEFEIPVTLRR